MMMKADASVLVLVDLQQRLMPAIHAGDKVIAQAARLASIARLLDVPVLGTEQSPDALGSNVDTVRRLCERTVSKTSFDGSAGVIELLAQGRTELVLAGCEAHVCLLQTALGLLQRGFKVWIATDAAGSRRESDRDAGFARLAAEGARLVTSEMVAFEWLRDSRHPRFREVHALIK